MHRAPALLRSSLAVVAALAASAGCQRAERVDNEAIEDLARAAGEDLARLGFAVEEVAEPAGALSADAARDTAEECYSSVGDCQLCYSLDGGPLLGAFEAGTSPAACGADWTLRSAGAAYTVARTALVGTWSAQSLAGDYTIDMTGEREASLTTTTRDGVTERTVDWTLDELTATTTGFALSTIALELTYTGFADHTWSLSATGDAVGPQGNLIVDDGSVNCAISGEWETVALNCL
jgi:hypothetical protein